MKVEILTPPTTSFVVGRDLVGYAKVGNDPDVWEDLIPKAGAFAPQRGGTTTPKVNALDVGTLSVPLKDMDPDSDTRLRVGRRLRLVDEERGNRVLWFGRLSDIPATDAQTHMVTTLAATDAVDELSNANVKGIGVPGQVETLRSRVERLGALSTVALRHRYTTPPPVPASRTGWFARDPDGGALTVTSLPNGARITRAVGGVTVDNSLWVLIPTTGWPSGARISASVAVSTRFNGVPDAPGIANMAVGFVTGTGPPYSYVDAVNAPVSNPVSGGTFQAAPLRFEAGAALAIWLNPKHIGTGTLTVDVTDVSYTIHEPPPTLQAVGREASITEHLDMACDSVGAVWRPMLDGTVEVIEGALAAAVLGRLTDDPDDSGALASYTKLDLGYAATNDLINELTVTNHGPSSETTRVFTNAASIAAHGRRSASIDLCLATSDLLDVRAGELLAEASTPRWSPRSLTYVYEALPFVPDLYDLIDVRRRGVTHRCLVLGVSLELEPDPARPNGVKHLVTLTLRKVA